MDAYWNMHHKTRTRRHDKDRPATSAIQIFPRAEKLIAANRTERAACREAARGPWRLRRRMKNEVDFPPKLRGARSRLYRRRFLQVTGTLTLSENGLREEKNNNYFNGVFKK